MAWRSRVLAFGAILGILFLGSYAAGVRGFFSSTDHGLGRQILDEATRVEATATLAARIAGAVSQDRPVFAGANDSRTCPDVYAARATSIIEAMAVDEATATLGAASRRLRDAGWRVDAAPGGRARVNVSAHNRQGFLVSVTEQSGSEATSIEVTVTVPCSAVAAPAQVVATTTTTG